MSAAQMLSTSLLLGTFVLLAGCYGLLYCLARLRRSGRLGRAAAAAYLFQGLATGLLALGSLELWWKGLLVASFVAFAAIPPLTWRFLERLHAAEEQHS